jgi:hypothetical protein
MEGSDMAKATCTIVEDGVPCPNSGPIKRGWCRKHYKRWLRHGDPLGGTGTLHGVPLVFYDANVDRDTHDCVVWPYVTDGGYGRLWVDGKMVGVHVLACVRHHGPRPAGMDVCHAPKAICIGRACFNPRHLRWGTRAENAHDRLGDDTHNRGERHINSKLTEPEVLAIRADPRTQQAIAADYSVSPGHVGMIKSGKRWGWLTGVYPAK